MLIVLKKSDKFLIHPMRFIKVFFTLTLLSVCSSMSSQNPDFKLTAANQITKIHYYTFTGRVSSDQLEFLQQELKNGEFVSEVKIEYKAEKGAGQIRLISKEKGIVSEGDKQFKPTGIKKALLNKGLTPGEYRSETISTQ